MNTHEYQALIKTMTLKERFDLNQKLKQLKQKSKWKQ
jgi:hypothetical protein